MPGCGNEFVIVVDLLLPQHSALAQAVSGCAANDGAAAHLTPHSDLLVLGLQDFLGVLLHPGLDLRCSHMQLFTVPRSHHMGRAGVVPPHFAIILALTAALAVEAVEVAFSGVP